MIYDMFRKPKALGIAALLSVALVAGCIEDDLDTDFEDNSPTSFTPLLPQTTECPSACLNIDVTTTRGIPPACASQCPNVQTSTQCLAAGGAYNVYVQNGRAGADAGTLAQLYSQYRAQAGLTLDVVRRLGCG
ncbi:hypothetical protein E4191_09615 [Paracoccus liaowanqingii]|uniref:Uncharacterized protein n=2 Tax=Paracoccus liaowanqingii TaxID=2560053 RepID=A0A4P7HNY2_9RHOB|nr:hypothetical protein E4191_09615 [Paracoccus liaowanqingii]